MDLADQLRRDEGVMLRLYRDTLGNFSIGVGRNLSDVGISPDEADILLQNDILVAKRAVAQALPWSVGLDEVRIAVLLNMAFNMGIGSLLGFKDFLGAMQAGNYTKASQDMLKSKWAEQVGARAYRLSVQISTGVWQ